MLFILFMLVCTSSLTSVGDVFEMQSSNEAGLQYPVLLYLNLIQQRVPHQQMEYFLDLFILLLLLLLLINFITGSRPTLYYRAK